jgi:hypothetical protein
MSRQEGENMAKRKGTVRTRAGLPRMIEDPVFVAAGYGLPRKFETEYQGDGLRVWIEIQVLDNHAIARKVVITADAGISSTSLRKIPVRDIMASGCLDALWKVAPDEEGALAIWKPEKSDGDEVRRIVQSLVRYNPDVPEVRP